MLGEVQVVGQGGGNGWWVFVLVSLWGIVYCRVFFFWWLMLLLLIQLNVILLCVLLFICCGKLRCCCECGVSSVLGRFRCVFFIFSVSFVRDMKYGVGLFICRVLLCSVKFSLVVVFLVCGCRLCGWYSIFIWVCRVIVSWGWLVVLVVVCGGILQMFSQYSDL